MQTLLRLASGHFQIDAWIPLSCAVHKSFSEQNVAQISVIAPSASCHARSEHMLVPHVVGCFAHSTLALSKTTTLLKRRAFRTKVKKKVPALHAGVQIGSVRREGFQGQATRPCLLQPEQAIVQEKLSLQCEENVCLGVKESGIESGAHVSGECFLSVQVLAATAQKTLQCIGGLKVKSCLDTCITATASLDDASTL
jgi:hypothetical protein